MSLLHWFIKTSWGCGVFSDTSSSFLYVHDTSPRPYLRPIRAIWHPAAHRDPRGLQNYPHCFPVGRSGLTPLRLSKNARPCHLACVSLTSGPAAAALPPHFRSAFLWRDPFADRHAGGPGMGLYLPSPLHIDTLSPLLAPWSGHTFPERDHVDLPRPLTRRSRQRINSIRTGSSPGLP